MPACRPAIGTYSSGALASTASLYGVRTASLQLSTGVVRVWLVSGEGVPAGRASRAALPLALAGPRLSWKLPAPVPELELSTAVMKVPGSIPTPKS